MTHWTQHYLLAEYRDGARGECEDGITYLDCWGLVREARHLHLGKRLLPSWANVRNTMPKLFTRAYQAEATSMDKCNPEPGAIAAVFRGSLMVHVGLVLELDGRLCVLEINPKSGARIRTVKDFEAPYLRVIYYRDRDDADANRDLPVQD